MSTALHQPDLGTLPAGGFVDPPQAPFSDPYPFLRPSLQGLGQLDDYLVLRLLGSGGMGIVFLARDLTLGREVALKVINPHSSRDQKSREYFLREARAMAALEHENVVPVYHVGEANGVMFLAMPLLRGQTLESWLAGPEPRPWSEVVRIAKEVALGLVAAHEKGFVHRDIKPANIWLEQKDDSGRLRTGSKAGSTGSPNSGFITHAPSFRVKILDFGLARPVSTDQRLTATEFVVGTPGFLSPESILGKPPRPACDLFSLGAVLYQAFAGVPPFQGDSPLVTLMETVSEDPPSLAECVPDLPPAVADLVMQLLAKNPDHRPVSAAAVVEMLDCLERGEPFPEPLPPARTSLALQPIAPAAPPRSRWLVPLAAGVMLLSTGAAFLAGLWQRGSDTWAVSPDGPALRVAPDLSNPLASYEGLTAPAVGGGYSADGLTFFVLAEDGQAFEWHNGMSRQPQRTWKAHVGIGFGLAVSPDGKRIVSGGNDPEGVSRIVGWDVATLQPLYTLVGGETWTNRITINQTGTRAAATGRGNFLMVFDPRTGDELEPLGSRGNEWIDTAGISPDGTRVITGSRWDRFVRVWDTVGGVTLDKFGDFPGGVGAAVAFSPDGRTCAAGGGMGAIHLWDVDTGTAGPVLYGHIGNVACLAFDAAGRRLVSGGADGSVRVWDRKTGGTLAVFQRHTETVTAVGFAAHSRQIFSAGRDRRVFTWANPARVR